MNKYLVISLFAISFSSVLSADPWMSANEKINVSDQDIGKTHYQDQFKTASDKATHQRIRAHIAKNFPQVSGTIILRISDGLVIIDGQIDTQENQEKITDALEQINGVKHVVNNTQVKKS